MNNPWYEYVINNLDLVENDNNTIFVSIVSGSESDKIFWFKHLSETRFDTFRANSDTCIVSTCEGNRKGNFLGTLNAWSELKQYLVENHLDLPSLSLMSMVFGKGTRLSPFTQAMGNRKPALLTPFKSKRINKYLSIVDISNLYSNVIMQHLKSCGFNGMLVKWGDEAIIPGITWKNGLSDFQDYDAVRFISRSSITETLAKEKEWIVYSANEGIMKFQLPRQEVNLLLSRIEQMRSDNISDNINVGVNLGSFAISYDFLDIALDVFRSDIADPNKWIDWDPFTWIALCCDQISWNSEIKIEEDNSRKGIKELEFRIPGFYEKISLLRNSIEMRKGRSIKIGILDFGNALWVDLGLHITLRKNLELLLEDSNNGKTMRALFNIPEIWDNKGNIIINSNIHPKAKINNSIIVDSTITNEHSEIINSIVISGKHRRLWMPYGGIALFCAADDMVFRGPGGIAIKSIGKEIQLPEKGRHTSIILSGTIESLTSNESITDYSGNNYYYPIEGNRYSFNEIGKILSEQNYDDIEADWFRVWNSWLERKIDTYY